jgi:hypothetical protein
MESHDPESKRLLLDGARGFKEHAMHIAMMDSCNTNRMSRVSKGCRDTAHSASDVDHRKVWRPAQ